MRKILFILFVVLNLSIKAQLGVNNGGLVYTLLGNLSFTQTELLNGYPSNLIGHAVSSTEIDLSWVNNSTNEDGIIIERSIDNYNYLPIHVVLKGVSSYSNIGLTANTTYYYKIKAFKGIYSSVYSSTVSTSTSSTPVNGNPSSLIATAISTTEIDMVWTNGSTNEDGISILRSTNNVDFTEISIVTAGVSIFSDITVAPTINYYYKVRAFKGLVTSSYSNTSSDNSYQNWYLAGSISPLNVVAVYQPLGASSLINSYVNLINPGTYDLTEGVPIDFSTQEGWMCNRYGYLKTGIIPVNNQTWSIIVKINSFPPLVGGYIIDMGQNSTPYAGAALGAGAGGSSTTIFQNGNSLNVANDLMVTGTLAFAGNKRYEKGILVTGDIVSASQTFTNDLWIGAQNYGGTAIGIPWAGSIEEIAIYNTVLTGDQITAISNLLDNPKIVALAPMPSISNQHGFEQCNGKLYKMGGAGDKKVYEYDPTTDIWTTKADLPFAANDHQSPILRCVNNKLYYIGGLITSGADVGNVYEYDPATDTYVEKTPMPTLREDFGSFVLNNKIYCFGGLTGAPGTGTPTNVMEVYDPATDTWDQTKADLPVAKWSGDFGCAVNGKGYAIGSTNTYVGYPSLTPVNTVYCYDPNTDSWSTKAPIPVSTCYKECEPIGNNIYVISGVGLGATTTLTSMSSDIYIYNTISDVWTKCIFKSPYKALGSALASLNGKIYMCGGINNHLGNYTRLFRIDF